MKRIFLTMILFFVLTLEGPAFGVTLNANDSATFKFNLNTTGLYTISYRMHVTDPAGNDMNWFGAYALYDELGESAVYSGSLAVGGGSYATDFGLDMGDGYKGLFNDPISYMTVTFYQGPDSSYDTAQISMTAGNYWGTVKVNGEVVTPAGVPEPLTLVLLGLGLLGMTGLGTKLRR